MHTTIRMFAIAVAGTGLLLLAGCQRNTKPAAAPAPAPVPESTHLSLSADALFAFGKSDLDSLSTDGHTQLDQLVDKLHAAKSITSVQVLGYTDRIGADAYNQKLSQQRAESVRDYLVSHGIAGDVITAEGHGKADPVADCPKLHGKKLRACLAPNRRVEVNITAMH